MKERESYSDREREREREIHKKRERESVSVCVWERDKVKMSQKMLQGQAKAKKEENVRMLHFTFSFHERIISPSLIFYQRRCNFRFFLRMKTPTTTFSLFSKEKKILNISKAVFQKVVLASHQEIFWKNFNGRMKLILKVLYNLLLNKEC